MRRVLISTFCAILAACGSPDDEPARQGPRPEPVVVYASHDNAAYWPGLFAGFTRDTGIRVTVKHGDADRIVADVIAKRGSPPADVLLTPGVAGIWRAADEGALLPLASDVVSKQVPERFRDPDGYWTGISHRAAEIVMDSAAVVPIEIAHYEELSRPDYKGRLCLSTAALSVNRSIIAMLIRTHGVRPAEIIVRGWVGNLAIPPLDSEAKLLQAIDAGTCAVGIASTPAVLQYLNAHTSTGDSGIARKLPQPAYADVDAVAINRHAREPDAARRLIEWLLTPEIQAAHSERSGQYPVVLQAGAEEVGDNAAATIGAFDEEAGLLAERARYW